LLYIIYINTKYIITLIDCKFLKNLVLNLFIKKIQAFIFVYNIDIARYLINNYFVLNIYIKNYICDRESIAHICRKIYIINRLAVGSDFGSNFRNRPDPTIPTLEIDPKPESISIILESIRFDPSRYSVLIVGIESNCQGIENNVIMPRYTKNSIK